METKLFFIRKIKGLFLRFGLHRLIDPFSNVLLNAVYLSKFSKWRKSIPKPKFDDFYNKKFGPAKRYELFNFVFESENLNLPIDYLEFGVAFGHSFEWWINNNKAEESRFFGFDTFEGLPEDYNFIKKNEMSTKGAIPDFNDPRYKFFKGLFQNTLPGFLKEFQSQRKKVIHLDADLYSATLFVLASLAPFLNKGDIILFDEFGVPMHEFRAFQDFFNSFYLKYEVIASCNNYFQIAIKII